MDTNDTLQLALEQLYERVNLTDNLTDNDARILLSWGETQLKKLAAANLEQEQFEESANLVQRVMRAVNRLVGQRADIDNEKMRKSMLRLLTQAISLAGGDEQTLEQWQNVPGADSIINTANQLIEQKLELSDTEMVEGLLQLADQVRQFLQHQKDSS